MLDYARRPDYYRVERIPPEVLIRLLTLGSDVDCSGERALTGS